MNSPKNIFSGRICTGLKKNLLLLNLSESVENYYDKESFSYSFVKSWERESILNKKIKKVPEKIINLGAKILKKSFFFQKNLKKKLGHGLLFGIAAISYFSSCNSAHAAPLGGARSELFRHPNLANQGARIVFRAPPQSIMQRSLAAKCLQHSNSRFPKYVSNYITMPETSCALDQMVEKTVDSNHQKNLETLAFLTSSDKQFIADETLIENWEILNANFLRYLQSNNIFQSAMGKLGRRISQNVNVANVIKYGIEQKSISASYEENLGHFFSDEIQKLHKILCPQTVDNPITFGYSYSFIFPFGTLDVKQTSDTKWSISLQNLECLVNTTPLKGAITLEMDYKTCNYLKELMTHFSQISSPLLIKYFKATEMAFFCNNFQPNSFSESLNLNAQKVEKIGEIAGQIRDSYKKSNEEKSLKKPTILYVSKGFVISLMNEMQFESFGSNLGKIAAQNYQNYKISKYLSLGIPLNSAEVMEALREFTGAPPGGDWEEG